MKWWLRDCRGLSVLVATHTWRHIARLMKYAPNTIELKTPKEKRDGK